MSRAPGSTRAGAPRRPGPLRVLIVDDHPIVRAGLAQMIEDEPDMTVCGECATQAAALGHVHTGRPDLAVVDLSLGEGSGLDLVRAFNVSQPGLHILVLSMLDERLYAERALRAGAGGYIMKHEARHALLDAIRRVANGKTYLSDQMSDRVLAQIKRRRAGTGESPFERLSDREREVYELIGRGQGTRQIADHLHLSVKTIESHRARIKEKLGLRTATELIRSATTWAQHSDQRR